ncbi:hypothetical protein G5I_09844 [Acromyrmex echinatior]|uniref:Uncharacterized protein n=1 Tax=Acromyrmex echinatior TaxID=103372 RepID=F4WV53_ACREC|nr:hypothetical protein G5I_09844 [Acromyrmex echinatior]
MVPIRRTARSIYAEEVAAVAALKAILYCLRSRNDHSRTVILGQGSRAEIELKYPVHQVCVERDQDLRRANDLASFSSVLFRLKSRLEELIAGATILLQYPSTLSSELLPADRIARDELDHANVPGILPTNADISPAARDLLKRLLQPDPRLRLRTLLSLQRIAFYMGYNIQNYMLKKESPFRILAVKNRQEMQQQRMDCFNKKFSNFESFPDDITT